MDYHVLVLAMSTLPPAIKGKEDEKGNLERDANGNPFPMSENKYALKESEKRDSEKSAVKRETEGTPREQDDRKSEEYRGLGQLEVIPQFIRSHLKADITHIFILETKEVRKAIDYVKEDPKLTCERIAELYGDKYLSMEGLVTISHTQFFERRMGWLGITPAFEHIDVDVDNPSEGLANLQEKIRKLYKDCLAAQGDWKLWLDTHGGFREVSSAMFGLMQMLAAPDEQDFVGYTADERMQDSIKRLTDGRDTVPVTGVYSVEFNPADAKQGAAQHIVDRTNFYSVFTKPAVEAYMNYGQYAQMLLKPEIDLRADNVPAFSFISYRRLDASKERYTVLGTLKKLGFRYWYDDAIKPQADWQWELETANKLCNVFIALVSEGYYDSYRCVQELKQALDSKKLIVLVSLDNKVSIKGPEGGIFKKHPSDNLDPIRISRVELDSISDKQQITLKNKVIEGVLQTTLADDFEKLAQEFGVFRKTRDDEASRVESNTYVRE